MKRQLITEYMTADTNPLNTCGVVRDEFPIEETDKAHEKHRQQHKHEDDEDEKEKENI